MFKSLRYHPPTRSAEPPDTPLLIFDGDCDFCLAFVQFIRRHARTSITLTPFSRLNENNLLTSLDDRQILASAHYITADGREYHGEESIIRALALVPGGRTLAVFNVWGLALLRELGYELVASNRPVFSKLIRLLSGQDTVARVFGRKQE